MNETKDAENSMRQTHTANRGRTIAVGDIHGCSRALSALIEAIRPQPEDTLVFLGDYIDGGPDSRGVLDQLIELRERCSVVPLTGNHEVLMRDALNDPSLFGRWLDAGGDATIDSYGELLTWADLPVEHRRFLDAARSFHVTETAIFVHANYAPNRSMPQQSDLDLFWRPLNPAEVGRHFSGRTVYCGHTPQTDGRILNLDFVVCLDTNCARGGWLTALDVDSGKVWQANQAGEVRLGELPEPEPAIRPARSTSANDVTVS